MRGARVLTRDHFIGGKVCLYIVTTTIRSFFIYKGAAMEVIVNPETFEETTSFFWFEDDFVYTTPGFFSQGQSPGHIVLLQDSILVKTKFRDFIKMKREFPEVDPLAENIRSFYETKKNALVLSYLLPAEERVKLLESEHPNIYNIAEIQHIAQYLRMNVRTLFRLRGR